jgi:hypothetical protein
MAFLLLDFSDSQFGLELLVFKTSWGFLYCGLPHRKASNWKRRSHTRKNHDSSGIRIQLPALERPKAVCNLDF